MKKALSQNELSDADLQKLFRRQQHLPSPADLDARILSAAAQSVRSDVKSTASRQPKGGSWRGGFALAALLVLSISLLPLLEPFWQPLDESSEIPALKTTADIPAAASSSTVKSAVHFDRQTGRAAPSLAESVEQKPQPSEHMEAAKSRIGMAREEGDAADTSTTGAGDFRGDPQLWLDYIEKLRQQDELDKASNEEQRFKNTYPDYPLQQR